MAVVNSPPAAILLFCLATANASVLYSNSSSTPSSSSSLIPTLSNSTTSTRSSETLTQAEATGSSSKPDIASYIFAGIGGPGTTSFATSSQWSKSDDETRSSNGDSSELYSSTLPSTLSVDRIGLLTSSSTTLSATGGSTKLEPIVSSSNSTITVTQKTTSSATVSNATSSHGRTDGTTWITGQPANTSSVVSHVASNSTGRSFKQAASRASGMPLPSVSGNMTARHNSTKSTSKIAPTGSGLLYASECDSLYAAFSSAEGDWIDAHAIYYDLTSSWTMSLPQVSTKYYPSTSTYCLGATRIFGGEVSEIMTYSIKRIPESFEYQSMSLTATPTLPTPACSFPVSDCNGLWDQYDASSSSIVMNGSNLIPALEALSMPSCPQSRPAAHCAQCTISASEVRLINWPDDVVATGPCDPNKSYITPTPTIPGQPNTAVFENSTLTSPTVYLSFDQVFAVQASNHHFLGSCGGTVASTIIALPVEDVSTIRFTGRKLSTTYGTSINDDFWTAIPVSVLPLDYHDLQGAVPVDAWLGMFTLAILGWILPEMSSTIIDNSYQPNLAVPEALRTADPFWNNCELYLEGIWDPPIPLLPVSTIIGPSSMIATSSEPVQTVTESAAPASQPASPQPARTTSISPGPSSTSVPDPGAPSSSPIQSSKTAMADPAASSSPYTSEEIDPAATFTFIENSAVSEIPDPAEPISNPPTSKVIDPAVSTTSIKESTVSESPDPVDPTSNPAVTSSARNQFPSTTTSPDQQSGLTISEGLASVISASPNDPTQITSSGDPAGVILSILDQPPSATVAVVSIGYTAVTAAVDGSGVVIIGTHTISASQETTISGHIVSVASNAVMVDGSTADFRPANTPNLNAASSEYAVVSDGDTTFTAYRSGSVAIADGQSLTVGGSALTIGGHEVSLASTGLAVASFSTATFRLVTPSDPLTGKTAIFTLDGQSVTASQDGGRMMLADGETTITLQPSADQVLQGHTISAAANNGAIVVDGISTVPLIISDPSTATQPGSQATLTLDDHIITAIQFGPDVLLQDGSASATLRQGSALTFEGQSLSVLPNGGGILVNGASTKLLAVPTTVAQSMQATAVIDGQVVTARPLDSSAVELAFGSRTMTVSDGSSMTVAGEVISVLADGSGIAVMGRSVVSFLNAKPRSTPNLVFSLDAEAITAKQHGSYIVLEEASSTTSLEDGSATTMNGHILSAANNGGYIIVDGTKTETLIATPTTVSLTSETDASASTVLASSTQGGSSGEGPSKAADPTSTTSTAAVNTGSAMDWTSSVWITLALSVVVIPLLL